MAKKRKSNGTGFRSNGKQDLPAEVTKYSANETFADSEDEFFAGKDQILLEDEPTNKRRRLEKNSLLQESDEEVLGYDEEELSDDIADDIDDDADEDPGDLSSEGSERDEDEEEEDKLRDWGQSKADYYNADVIETEADARDEEQEARRLQQKQLEGLTEADFGLDEVQWTQEDADAGESTKNIITERLPELEVDENATIETKTQILQARYPEFEPLIQDFVNLQKEHILLRDDTNDEADHVNSIRSRSLQLKSRALSAYLGSIGMYLALLTSTASPTSKTGLALPPTELRNHPIIQSLLRSRAQWERASKLEVPEPEISAAVTGVLSRTESSIPAPKPVSETIGTHKKAERAKKRMSKSEKAAAAAQKLAQADRELRIQKAEQNVKELDNLILTNTKASKTRPSRTAVKQHDDSDMGDEDTLTAHEVAEKAQRKRSLRFYTSQIAQKSNKRDAASRHAGGDLDLPYKEPWAEQRKGKGSEARSIDQDLEENEQDHSLPDTNEEQKSAGRQSDREEDYYTTISRRTQQKKASSQHNTPSSTQSQVQTYAEDPPSPSGKRGLPYEIAKNKGLAPKRRKEVRNPRVKRKLKYEQKMKKLGSVRQVWKGGEGRGGYGGEATGIKVNLLKGRKL